jgi:cytidylate kinase
MKGEQFMSIITISRGSYSRGKEVAEKVAQALGYECISRDVLIEASEQFNIPEIKLVRAIHDAPSLLERFGHGKERYVAYIRAALLTHVQKDNVVYHGLAGHFFLMGIPHVLKVRIIADIEDRIKEEMKRENISAEMARYVLKKDDDERRKWGLKLYGIDTSDPSLYDMVLHIKTMKVEDAVKILVDTVNLPNFQTTPESQRILDDLCLAAQIQAALVQEFPTVKVSCADGEARVGIVAPLALATPISAEQKTIARVKNQIMQIPRVKNVTVNVVPSISAD